MAIVPDAEVPGDAPAESKDLRDRVAPVVAKVVRELGDAPDADPEDLLRDVVHKVGARLNESICTEAEYEDGAEAAVADVARELLSARNEQRRAKASSRPAHRGARPRRGVSRPPGDAGGTTPPAAEDPPGGEEPPAAEDPPEAEDVPSPRGTPIDIAAIVAAQVERASAPLRERLSRSNATSRRSSERRTSACAPGSTRSNRWAPPEPAVAGRVLPDAVASGPTSPPSGGSGQITFTFTALQAARGRCSLARSGRPARRFCGRRRSGSGPDRRPIASGLDLLGVPRTSGPRGADRPGREGALVDRQGPPASAKRGLGGITVPPHRCCTTAGASRTAGMSTTKTSRTPSDRESGGRPRLLASRAGRGGTRIPSLVIGRRRLSVNVAAVRREVLRLAGESPRLRVATGRGRSPLDPDREPAV